MFQRNAVTCRFYKLTAYKFISVPKMGINAKIDFFKMHTGKIARPFPRNGRHFYGSDKS
jgi:hypothetical protein